MTKINKKKEIDSKMLLVFNHQTQCYFKKHGM